MTLLLRQKLDAKLDVFSFPIHFEVFLFTLLGCGVLLFRFFGKECVHSV